MIWLQILKHAVAVGENCQGAWNGRLVRILRQGGWIDESVENWVGCFRSIEKFSPGLSDLYVFRQYGIQLDRHYDGILGRHAKKRYRAGLVSFLSLCMLCNLRMRLHNRLQCSWYAVGIRL
jgi:hypothetical protein